MKPSEQHVADALLAGLIEARQQHEIAAGPFTATAAKKTWYAIHKIALTFATTLQPDERKTFLNYAGDPL